MRPHLTILGAGAWGKALAHAAVGCQSVLWDRNPDTGGLTDLSEALSFSQKIIMAVPAQSVREVAEKMRPFPPELCLLASKGFEQSTGLLLSEVLQEVLPSCQVGALGGPNLAREVLEGLPCGATLAFSDPSALAHACDWFRDSFFKVAPCNDPLGVQVASALKNVMAIGYGLLQQTNPSENLWATYLTQALHEIRLFIQAVGGNGDTALTYAGIGDLILTCTSAGSRNSQFGRHFPHASAQLVEGQFTLYAALKRAQTQQLSVPLLTELEKILSSQKPLAQWPDLVSSLVRSSC